MLRAPPATDPVQLDLHAMLQSLKGPGARPGEAFPRATAPCELRARLRCPGCGATQTRTRICARVCRGCPRQRGPRASALVSVLPRVPLRHWIYTPTADAQGALGGDPALVRWLARRFVREIFAELGVLDGPRKGGAATVVHWTTRGLERRIHVHALALDGGFVTGAGHPCFESASEAVRDTAALTVARRVARALRRRLATTRASGGSERASSSRSPPRIAATAGARSGPSRVTGARADGASVRVTAPIGPDDRTGLVRLARYLTRPWLEPDRVVLDTAGQATLALARTRSDGTTALAWEADAMREQILGVVPPAHTHPIAFHGVLAPRAALRGELVPGQLPLWEPGEQARPPRGRETKARREPERCERCGVPLVLENVEVAIDDLHAR